MARKHEATENRVTAPDIALHMLMNDSGPLLLDWVLHHRHLGFGRITVHGDGANDQATALARALAKAGLIDFVPTKRPGVAHARAREIRVQEQVLKAEIDNRSDYLLWLEPEDMLVIDTGQGQLADLAAGLEAFPDLLSLTVLVAGGSGQLRFSDAPLPERFDRGTGGASGPLMLAAPIRTIFRPNLARGLNTNRPRLKPKFARGKEPVTWLNGAAEDVSERYLQKGWLAMPDQPGLGLAHVICFLAQDRETFLLRRTGSGKTLPFMTPGHLKSTIQQYLRLNFSMAEMGPAGAGAEDLASRRRAFLADHPQIAAKQAEVVVEFSGRLDRLLAEQDSKAVEIVIDFLEGRTSGPEAFQWSVPFGRQVTPPALSETNSAWAERLTREDDGPKEQDDWAGTDDEAEAPPAQAAAVEAPLIGAPTWLADLRLSGEAHGFYHSMPNYACTYVARSRKHLLVSFDNLASVRDNPIARDPWGYSFIRKQNWSHLGVLSFVPGWFRDSGLHDYLNSIKGSGFFEQFDQVTMFGTSMGGYGAAAFASLAPGCRVAAFSPQSSLAPQLAGWDLRYPTGRQADWKGAFSDAAHEVRAASQAWLFYDPAVDNDRRHIERFTSDNVRRIPLRYSNHKTALMLRNGGILSAVMRDIVTGEASVASLMRYYRACRTLPEFVTELRARAERTGGASRREAVDKAVELIRGEE